MNKNLQKLLESMMIEETLEDLILCKTSYLKRLRASLKKMYDFVLEKDLVPLDQLFWEMVIHYLYGGDKIKNIEREINKLCHHRNTVINLHETKNSYRRNWQNIYDQVQALDVEDVLSRYVEISNIKSNVKCPLHDDSTPSLKIYSATNSWYCFGCSKGGSPINFVMAFHDVDFKGAVKILFN